jgi:uncharacterized protein
VDLHKSNDIFQRYLKLRTAAETLTSELFDTYRSEITCAKGCSECCDDISVLPIEWYLLRKWFEEHHRELDAVRRPRYYGENRCPFLHKADKSCSIYPIRPIICRVHGLPIRYTVEEYDVTGQRVFRAAPEYSFAWCELNFIGHNPKESEVSFAPKGFIDMESWNHALRKLNSEFLAAVTPEELPENVGWFSLSTLVE